MSLYCSSIIYENSYECHYKVGSGWPQLALVGPIWARFFQFCPVGPFSHCLALFWTVWPCLALFGLTWPCLHPIGSVWPNLALFGPEACAKIVATKVTASRSPNSDQLHILQKMFEKPNNLVVDPFPDFYRPPLPLGWYS